MELPLDLSRTQFNSFVIPALLVDRKVIGGYRSWMPGEFVNGDQRPGDDALMFSGDNRSTVLIFPEVGNIVVKV